MTEIVAMIFQVCIIPLLGALTAKLISYLNAKKENVVQNTNSELVAKYVDRLHQIIERCVIATNQTYVDALKAEGKFDLDAQKIAFEKTFNSVKALITSEMQDCLTEAISDLNLYIQQNIECTVKCVK